MTDVCVFPGSSLWALLSARLAVKTRKPLLLLMLREHRTRPLAQVKEKLWTLWPWLPAIGWVLVGPLCGVI